MSAQGTPPRSPLPKLHVLPPRARRVSNHNALDEALDGLIGSCRELQHAIDESGEVLAEIEDAPSVVRHIRRVEDVAEQATLEASRMTSTQPGRPARRRLR